MRTCGPPYFKLGKNPNVLAYMFGEQILDMIEKSNITLWQIACGNLVCLWAMIWARSAGDKAAWLITFQ